MPSAVYKKPFIIRPQAGLLQSFPELKRNADALSRKYAAFHEPLREEDLRHIGEALWKALEQDAALENARKKAGANILPVIIESKSAALQQLPWETLYHPVFGFLGKSSSFTLSRRISARDIEQRELETGPLRILLFTSMPDDLDAERGRLNVEEEQIRVQEALMPWTAEGRVQLEMPDDGRFETLKELLQSFRPHLLFLSGHGQFHHQPHEGREPHGVFLFESAIGMRRPVREEEIADGINRGQGGYSLCPSFLRRRRPRRAD